MKEGHSPLPWSTNVWSTGRWTIHDKFGMQVCELNPTHAGQGSPKENAEFIERTTTAFYALVEEHRVGECFCANPDEARNVCEWCVTEATLLNLGVKTS